MLDQRHGYYSRALLLNYGALFAFVTSSLLFFATLFSRLPRELAVAAFGVGVTFLAGMSAFAVAAIALARKTIHHEVEEILLDAKRRDAEP